MKAATFFLAACQYPAGVLERTRQVRSRDLLAAPNVVGPADRALKRLARQRQRLLRATGSAPSVLLAGDQVYVDATAGLFDPSTRDQPWDRAWDQRNANQWMNLALGESDRLALLDDHEIVDNWEPSADPARSADLFEIMYRGRSRFIHRMRGGQSRPGAPSECRDLWYASQIEGRFLFLGDTRTERDIREPGTFVRDSHLFSADQFRTLVEGLRDACTKGIHHKLIATSAMLLPRPLLLAGGETQAALRCDSWCGYPASLHRMLATLVEFRIHGCVFLSGDEHLPCLATLKVLRRGDANSAVTAHSIHTGALYAPYPFANARSADFVEDDVFDFSCDGTSYRCEVKATFPAKHHEGFMWIKLDQPPAGPRLAVHWCDALDRRHDLRMMM